MDTQQMESLIHEASLELVREVWLTGSWPSGADCADMLGNILTAAGYPVGDEDCESVCESCGEVIVRDYADSEDWYHHDKARDGGECDGAVPIEGGA